MNQVEPLVADLIFKYLFSQRTSLRSHLTNAASESEEPVRSFGSETSELTGGRSEWCIREFCRPGQSCSCPTCAGERGRDIRFELTSWAVTASAWAVACGYRVSDAHGVIQNGSRLELSFSGAGAARVACCALLGCVGDSYRRSL